MLGSQILGLHGSPKAVLRFHDLILKRTSREGRGRNFTGNLTREIVA